MIIHPTLTQERGGEEAIMINMTQVRQGNSDRINGILPTSEDPDYSRAYYGKKSYKRWEGPAKEEMNFVGISAREYKDNAKARPSFKDSSPTMESFLGKLFLKSLELMVRLLHKVGIL